MYNCCVSIGYMDTEIYTLIDASLSCRLVECHHAPASNDSRINVGNSKTINIVHNIISYCLSGDR